MMSREAILHEVRILIREKLNVDAPIALETQIVGDLQLDSLKRLTLAVEIENRFAICLDPEDEHGIVTVDDIVTVVRRRLGDGSPE